MSRRRGGSAVTDLLSDIVDDIKDFLDDEVLDRGRDTERDLRRAGRNWTDSDSTDRDRRSRRNGGRGLSRGAHSDDDLGGLRDVLRTLSTKVDALARDAGGGRPPIAGYDEMTVPEITERLGKLSQSELRAAAAYEKAHDNRTTLLDRLEVLCDEEPWPGYDEQTVAQISAALTSADELTARSVRDYETKHKDRQGVLVAAQSALDT